MVSDRPDGMIIGTGRPDCDTTGFGDPAGLPITDGDIVVMPRAHRELTTVAAGRWAC
jgi:hypothetical protein